MTTDKNTKTVGKSVKSNSDTYEIYLGTFIDNAFTWYSISKFKDPTKAYKEFKTYVNTQLKYTDEELQQVWDTGRLDIELRQGNKLLNWVGIYSREVKPLSKEEEKEAEKAEVKKESSSKKDSVDEKEIFKVDLEKAEIAGDEDSDISITELAGEDTKYFKTLLNVIDNLRKKELDDSEEIFAHEMTDKFDIYAWYDHDDDPKHIFVGAKRLN